MNPTDSDPKKCSNKPIDWKSVLIILGVFVTGLVLGAGSQHLNRQGPRPMAGGPFPGMQKFHDGKPGPGQFQGRPGFSKDREQGKHFGDMRREPSPEMKEYAEKVKAVLDPYKAKIEAVLTPEQKDKLASLHGGPRDKGKEGDKGPAAGPEGRKGPEFKRGGPRGPEPLMGLVIYKPVLERMSEHLALNDKQKAQVEKIMTERRDALLKFVDQNPPPAPERGHRKEA